MLETGIKMLFQLQTCFEKTLPRFMAINMTEIVDTLYCLGLRKPHISEAGSASVFRHNRGRETPTMVGQLERTTGILNPWTFLLSLSLSLFETFVPFSLQFNY
jgi:hypothetical protein